jgi:hypothetical protein
VINLTGQTLHLSGNITNQGAINNVSTVPGSNTNIQVADGTTLGGTGSLTMSGPAAQLFGENPNDRLTNAAGHTIQGRGSLGLNNMTLTNQGTIVSNQNNPQPGNVTSEQPERTQRQRFIYQQRHRRRAEWRYRHS